MCIFVDQFGNVRFAYQKYGVDQTSLAVRADGPAAYPRKVRPNMPIDLVHNAQPGPAGAVASPSPTAAIGNWGMNTGRFDWNARDDRLAESPLWSAMWGRPECHVLVPVSHGTR